MKYFILLSFLISLLVFADGRDIPCNAVFTEQGFICRCNSSYCDMFPEIPENRSAIYHLITGRKIPGYNLVTLQDTDSVLDNAVEINVNLSVIKNENLIGFGGTFTDSFGYVLRTLNPKAQNLLLRSYFAPEGNRYNLCRIVIGVSDSTPVYYNYDSVPNDLTLSHFSLRKEDFEYKISVFNEALKMKKNKDLKLVASIWSPPPWMKKNNSTYTGYLRDGFSQLEANYITRFLKDYKKEGVNFWGITTTNQGIGGIFGHTSSNTIMFPHQQRTYIAKHLGPTLIANGLGDLKIIINDGQRRFISWVMDVLIEDPVAYNYTSGVGIHWYLDPVTSVEMMDDVHENYPGKFLLYTESSISDRFHVEPGQGSWYGGTLYGHSIIETLNHYSSGWIDWNMALNPNGGPDSKGALTDSPIIVETEKNEFYKQPTFYILGHFSALTEPGGKVLGIQTNTGSQKRTKRDNRPTIPNTNLNLPPLKEGFFTTAVSNPDGRIIVFILNSFEGTR